MTVIILDPSLTDEHGHHLKYDLEILREAARRGHGGTIFTNACFKVPVAEKVEIKPYFSRNTYPPPPQDVREAYEVFVRYNDDLRDELTSLLRTTRFKPDDLVLVPTVSEYQLLGFVSWMKSFAPADAPLFVVQLMFPSGLSAKEEAPLDPLQALFYHLAFRAAEGPGPNIRFYAGSTVHAEEFTRLAGRPIDAHPSPLTPSPPKSAPATEGPIVLYAGDLKVDKGIMLMPALVEALAAKHPKRRFVIHANPSSGTPEARRVVPALNELAGRLDNFEFSPRRLEEAEYIELLANAALVTFTYNPSHYRRKSSGVLWETLSLGRPLVAPAGTWLEVEAQRYGAGLQTYTEYSPIALLAAIDEALADLPKLAARAGQAAQKFRAANGAQPMFDQFGAVWAARIAAAALHQQAERLSLPIEGLPQSGWYPPEVVNGKPARWSGASPRFEFEWPWTEPWELQLQVEFCFAVQQIGGAAVFVNDEQAVGAFDANGPNRGVLRIDGRNARAAGRVQVRLELSSTHRVPNDPRDLGILVSSIAVEPRETVDGVDGAVVIRSDVKLDGAGAFELAHAVSGTFAADPRRTCSFALTVEGASPERVRGLKLFVNGAPVRLEAAAQADGTWTVWAVIAPAVLSAGGLLSQWDLVPGAPGVRCRELRILPEAVIFPHKARGKRRS